MEISIGINQIGLPIIEILSGISQTNHDIAGSKFGRWCYYFDSPATPYFCHILYSIHFLFFSLASFQVALFYTPLPHPIYYYYILHSMHYFPFSEKLPIGVILIYPPPHPSNIINSF